MSKSKVVTLNNAKSLATFISKIADDKIVSNIVVMDMTGIENAPSEYFVICSCDSASQLEAVSDYILRQIRSTNIDKPRVEGITGGEWVLIDFFDVVMHLMLPEIRSLYNIEKLWADAIFYKFNSTTLKLNKITQSEIIHLISGA